MSKSYISDLWKTDRALDRSHAKGLFISVQHLAILVCCQGWWGFLGRGAHPGNPLAVRPFSLEWFLKDYCDAEFSINSTLKNIKYLVGVSSTLIHSKSTYWPPATGSAGAKLPRDEEPDLLRPGRQVMAAEAAVLKSVCKVSRAVRACHSLVKVGALGCRKGNSAAVWSRAVPSPADKRLPSSPLGLQGDVVGDTCWVLRDWMNDKDSGSW